MKYPGGKTEFILRRLVLAALVTWVLLLGLQAIADGDIWFHMAGGRFTVENMHPPFVDSFSFTSEGQPYISIHWLFQLLAFTAYSALGVTGLVLLKTVLIGTVAALAWFALGLKVDSNGSYVLFLLTILGCTATFTLRPLLLTMIYLLTYLLVWRKNRHFWLFPLIMLLWVNTQGLFILGFFVVGAWALPDPRKRLKWLAATVAAAFLNPYGIHGFLFPFLLFTRIGESNVYSRNIMEFSSLLRSNVYLSHAAGWAALILFAASAASLYFFWQNKPRTVLRSAAHAILLAGFAYLYFLALRNLGLFCLVAGWTVSMLMQDRIHRAFTSRRLCALAAAVVVLGGGAREISRYLKGYPRVLHGHHGYTPLARLARHSVPSGAVDYLKKHNWKGRMFNDFNWGGYLIFRFSPQNDVFIDQRLEVHSRELFTQYVKLQKDPERFQSMDADYDFDIALFCHIPFRGMPGLVGELQNNQNWQLVYMDELSVIFAKKRPVNQTLLQTPPEIHLQVSHANLASLRAQYLATTAAGINRPDLQSLYPKAINGNAHLLLRNPAQALGLLLDAGLNEGASVGDLHLLIGTAAFAAGDQALLGKAVERVWVLQPSHPELPRLQSLRTPQE